MTDVVVIGAGQATCGMFAHRPLKELFFEAAAGRRLDREGIVFMPMSGTVQ